MSFDKFTHFADPLRAGILVALVAVAACQSTDSVAPVRRSGGGPGQPVFSSTSLTGTCGIGSKPPVSPGVTNAGYFLLWNASCGTIYGTLRQAGNVSGDFYELDAGAFQLYQAYSDIEVACFGPENDLSIVPACYSGPPTGTTAPIPVFIYSAPAPRPPRKRPRFIIPTRAAVIGVRG